MSGSLFELLHNCTVRLQAPGGYGTGFFVAPGLILTCAHVVEGARGDEAHIMAHYSEKDYQVQEIVTYLSKPYPDLALLRIDLCEHPCVYLDESITPHDVLYTYGYTEEHREGESTTLDCEGKMLTDNGESLVKLKAGQVRRGSSGSPLLNERTWGVCGVVKLSRDPSFDLGGGAIPTEVVLSRIPELIKWQKEFHEQDDRWMEARDRQRGVQIALAGVVIETKYFEPETIYVSPGPFLMGSQEGRGIPAYEASQHEVDLPAYRIGKYPVTNEQYAEFIRQTGRIVAPESSWEGQIPPDEKLKHPVIGVTWYDALAYCEWLSDQTGRQYSLPSEAQWEKAARGTDGRIYPWGDEWDSNRCNHGSDQTTPVDAYPAQTVYGCYDMVGNVREWTSTLWGGQLRAPDSKFCYPWANDHREDLTASSYVLRVYRGGAAADRIERLRSSARGAYFPGKPGPPRRRHGFRVVLTI